MNIKTIKRNAKKRNAKRTETTKNNAVLYLMEVVKVSKKKGLHSMKQYKEWMHSISLLKEYRKQAFGSTGNGYDRGVYVHIMDNIFKNGRGISSLDYEDGCIVGAFVCCDMKPLLQMN